MTFGAYSLTPTARAFLLLQVRVQVVTKVNDQSQEGMGNKGGKVIVHSRAGQQTVYVSEEEAVVHKRRNERTADRRDDRAPYPVLAIY